METNAVEIPVLLFLTKPKYLISVAGFTIAATLGVFIGMFFGAASLLLLCKLFIISCFVSQSCCLIFDVLCYC